MSATQFHNLTPSDLADTIGTLDKEAKAMKARLDAAKDELKARGIEEAVGQRYSVKVTVSTRKSLDTGAIKKSFGEEVLTQFQRFTDVFSVRVGVA